MQDIEVAPPIVSDYTLHVHEGQSANLNGPIPSSEGQLHIVLTSLFNVHGGSLSIKNLRLRAPASARVNVRTPLVQVGQGASLTMFYVQRFNLGGLNIDGGAAAIDCGQATNVHVVDCWSWVVNDRTIRANQPHPQIQPSHSTFTLHGPGEFSQNTSISRLFQSYQTPFAGLLEYNQSTMELKAVTEPPSQYPIPFLGQLEEKNSIHRLDEQLLSDRFEIGPYASTVYVGHDFADTKSLPIALNTKLPGAYFVIQIREDTGAHVQHNEVSQAQYEHSDGALYWPADCLRYQADNYNCAGCVG